MGARRRGARSPIRHFTDPGCPRVSAELQRRGCRGATATPIEELHWSCCRRAARRTVTPERLAHARRGASAPHGMPIAGGRASAARALRACRAVRHYAPPCQESRASTLLGDCACRHFVRRRALDDPDDDRPRRARGRHRSGRPRELDRPTAANNAELRGVDERGCRSAARRPASRTQDDKLRRPGRGAARHRPDLRADAASPRRRRTGRPRAASTCRASGPPRRLRGGDRRPGTRARGRGPVLESDERGAGLGPSDAASSTPTSCLSPQCGFSSTEEGNS